MPPETPSLFDLLSWYIVFVFSLVAHEASHAWAARALGDVTAYDGGQVTLDPTPHIRRSPMGMVVVPLASFLMNGWMIGWASAPYNRAWAEAFPRRAGLMAAAGPLANLGIVLGAFGLMKLGLALGVFGVPGYFDMSHVVLASHADWSYVAARILSIAYSLNIILLLFNLIPLPPLDGGTIIKLILPEAIIPAYSNLISQPAASWAGLLAAWFLFPQFGGQLLRYAVGLVG